MYIELLKLDWGVNIGRGGGGGWTKDAIDKKGGYYKEVCFIFSERGYRRGYGV